MSHILANCQVFKVFRAIVRFVEILMVYCELWLSWTNKSLCDKYVNQDVFSLSFNL